MKAAFTAGEWSGARQEVQNCITQLEANEEKGDDLSGLRSILPPEAVFVGDRAEESDPPTHAVVTPDKEA